MLSYCLTCPFGLGDVGTPLSLHVLLILNRA